MFVAQAHSFAQQARLAITLAWIAGYTNIIAILTCDTVISHVSGTASGLGRDIAERKWALAAFSLFLLGTFFAGAMLSGFMTEYARRLGRQSIYVAPMLAEALLLGLFAVGVELHAEHVLAPTSERYLLTGLASAAMGLQNATITRISGGVVRTTHVTGVVTDLGLEAARFFFWLRDRSATIPPAPAAGLARSLRHHPTARQLALLASILASFAVGAGLATLVHAAWPRWAMFPPVAFLLWIVYVDATRPIAAIEASDAAAMTLPDGLAVYRLARDRTRRGSVQRLPNLAAWLDRLPSRVKVVVLDLDAVTHLDANAAGEIVAALSRLRVQGRRMVLAGLSAEQYARLRDAGAANHLDPLSAGADLELAIARAMNLLEETAERPG